MSYLTQDEISRNVSLTNRVAQAAAQEGVEDSDPDSWAHGYRRTWAAAPGWEGAWESARVSHPGEQYDPGADEGVVTDGMILSQVQAMLAGSA